MSFAKSPFGELFVRGIALRGTIRRGLSVAEVSLGEKSFAEMFVRKPVLVNLKSF